MQILKVFYCLKITESKIQWSLILRNIKNIVFSDGYKLIWVGDKFSKSFKSYLGKDAVTVSLAVWSMKVSIVAM